MNVNLEGKTSAFETRAIPLLVVVVLLELSFIVAVISYALIVSKVLQQNLSLVSITWFVIWCILLGSGGITVIFSKMKIDKEGISLRSPWVSLFGYKGFPSTLYFNEICIKPKWGGRILIITRGKDLDLAKKIVWLTALLGGYWLMPTKWKETLKVLKKHQSIA